MNTSLPHLRHLILDIVMRTPQTRAAVHQAFYGDFSEPEIAATTNKLVAYGYLNERDGVLYSGEARRAEKHAGIARTAPTATAPTVARDPVPCADRDDPAELRQTAAEERRRGREELRAGLESPAQRADGDARAKALEERAALLEAECCNDCGRRMGELTRCVCGGCPATEANIRREFAKLVAVRRIRLQMHPDVLRGETMDDVRCTLSTAGQWVIETGSRRDPDLTHRGALGAIREGVRHELSRIRETLAWAEECLAKSRAGLCEISRVLEADAGAVKAPAGDWAGALVSAGRCEVASSGAGAKMLSGAGAMLSGSGWITTVAGELP